MTEHIPLYYNFFIHSFVDGHLGCFDVTSIVNRAAINTGAIVVVFQLLSQVWPFETPWTAACQASLSFTISWSLLKCMSIESVMPSHHLSSVVPFSSCLQSFPESGSFLMSQTFSPVAKVFSISPSNEYSGLLSFRINCFDLFAVQGTLKGLLQDHSSKASILCI